MITSTTHAIEMQHNRVGKLNGASLQNKSEKLELQQFGIWDPVIHMVWD